MAKKSKTQKAKASAARQQRKANRELEEQSPTPVAEATEEKKGGLFKKGSEDKSASSNDTAKSSKKEDKPLPVLPRREVRDEARDVADPHRCTPLERRRGGGPAVFRYLRGVAG